MSNTGVINRFKASVAVRLMQRIRELSRLNSYYVYIACNKEKTMLITGLTDSLSKEIDLWEKCDYNAIDTEGNRTCCIYLLYVKRFSSAQNAIIKEREINKWPMERKIGFIDKKNPQWHFLNDEASR